MPRGRTLLLVTLVAGGLALWVVLYLAMLSLTLWAGTRYRSPIEPALIILAATVLAGGWQRPTLATGGVAAVMTAGAIAIIAMSLEPVVTARASYGVDRWPVISDETRGSKGRPLSTSSSRTGSPSCWTAPRPIKRPRW